MRLQQPLDERYTDAALDELEARIAAAKAALGERVFILGHHYQRDEVIRWCDASGDSYRRTRCTRLASAPGQGRVVPSGCQFNHPLHHYVTRSFALPQRRLGGTPLVGRTAPCWFSRTIEEAGVRESHVVRSM